MDTAILAIGDELTLGQVLDTNSAWLAARLAERGLHATLHLTTGDDLHAIVNALRVATQSHRIVLVTGGLGPTDDDLTRPALSELLGVNLELHEPSLRQVESFFKRRNREMPARNRLQAMCPAGASMLENPAGTAPGIHARFNDADIFCIPGVPHEMRELYTRHVLPFLAAGPAQAIVTTKVNTFGAGESTIADLLGDLMDRRRNPMVGTTVSEGIIAVRIRSTFAHSQEAHERLEETVCATKARLGGLAFGRDEETLQLAVARALHSAGKTLSTAESCTGGLLGKRVTDIAGSSSFYLGGYVTYHNQAKTRDLGVPTHMIDEHGAVSAPVAVEMAEGCRRRFDSDFSLAITGVAGPGGGTPAKPVGTVLIALADRHTTTAVEQHLFPGDRTTIRDRAAKTALNMLRLRLLKP